MHKFFLLIFGVIALVFISACSTIGLTFGAQREIEENEEGSISGVSVVDNAKGEELKDDAEIPVEVVRKFDFSVKGIYFYGTFTSSEIRLTTDNSEFDLLLISIMKDYLEHVSYSNNSLSFAVEDKTIIVFTGGMDAYSIIPEIESEIEKLLVYTIEVAQEQEKQNASQVKSTEREETYDSIPRTDNVNVSKETDVLESSSGREENTAIPSSGALVRSLSICGFDVTINAFIGEATLEYPDFVSQNDVVIAAAKAYEKYPNLLSLIQYSFIGPNEIMLIYPNEYGPKDFEYAVDLLSSELKGYLESLGYLLDKDVDLEDIEPMASDYMTAPEEVQKERAIPEQNTEESTIPDLSSLVSFLIEHQNDEKTEVRVVQTTIRFINNGKIVNEIVQDAGLTIPGSALSYKPSSSSGKRFDGWAFDEYGDYMADSRDVINEDTDLYAVYTNMYSVKLFDGLNLLDTFTVAEYDYIRDKIDGFEKDGYKFLNWYVSEPSIAFNLNDDCITSDISLYANWAKLVTISFYDGEKCFYSYVSPTGLYIETPDEVPQNAFKVFEYWGPSEKSAEPYDLAIPISGDVQLYAVRKSVISAYILTGIVLIVIVSVYIGLNRLIKRIAGGSIFGLILRLVIGVGVLIGGLYIFNLSNGNSIGTVIGGAIGFLGLSIMGVGGIFVVLWLIVVVAKYVFGGDK